MNADVDDGSATQREVGLAVEIFRMLADGTRVRLLWALRASLTHASTPHAHGAATLASLPGGIDVRASACAWIGHQISAEAERDVDPSTSLAEAHSFAHRSEAEPVRTTPR